MQKELFNIKDERQVQRSDALELLYIFLIESDFGVMTRKTFCYMGFCCFYYEKIFI